MDEDVLFSYVRVLFLSFYLSKWDWFHLALIIPFIVILWLAARKEPVALQENATEHD